MTAPTLGIDWAAVWPDVAGRIAVHRGAGRGHLLTEDTVRLETVLSLSDHGVSSDRLAAEVLVPVLAGGKLDLVVDPPDGTVIELKYPRDSRTGFSPDTMTFGELLRDFLRVAAVPAQDRWVVQVVNRRLVRYLDGVCHRHGLHWPVRPGDVLELRPDVVATLPGTAVRAIGAATAAGTVTARCALTRQVDDELTLYAHQVDAAVAPIVTAAQDGDVPAAPAQPSTRAAAGRDGARRHIIDAARSIVTKTGQNTFTMSDVISEMHTRGTPYADATIRTMVSSHLCAEAAGDGVAGYTDFTRVGRGVYRLTDWTATS
jgi:hypothetical protein